VSNAEYAKQISNVQTVLSTLEKSGIEIKSCTDSGTRVPYWTTEADFAIKAVFL